MADITKAVFYDMLNCVTDPKIEERHISSDTGTCREQVVLAFSNNKNEVVECLRAKRIAPLMTLERHRRSRIVLAAVRYSKLNDTTWQKRLQLKKAQYCRWLADWPYTASYLKVNSDGTAEVAISKDGLPAGEAMVPAPWVDESTRQRQVAERREQLWMNGLFIT